MDAIGKKFKIKCGSKYFETKYGHASPIIQIVEESDYQKSFTPPTFLFLGRVYAEGRQELFAGKTFYGYIKGQGEIVNEIELGENVT